MNFFADINITYPPHDSFNRAFAQGDDFAEVLAGYGHALILHRGQPRVLIPALQQFISDMIPDEPDAPPTLSIDELASRLEVCE